jgi:2-polyprenyl-3-methyl-5-hydroxy-6-metoxy-1,4-benzoquinol methylase
VNFNTRSYEKEILDRENIPFSDMLTTMEELKTINTFLGGHSITRKGIDFFLKITPADRQLVIAEIGSGGGDNLVAIDKYLRKRKRTFSLIGVDIKPGCIHYAEQHAAKNITWLCCDYQQTKWPAGKPDVIFSSLFCHHFTDEQMVEQLKWLKENSTTGFFINDLHRHPVAYYSIKLLTRCFSRSYLVKNDGPLSVMRAFRKEDWVKLLAVAGIRHYSISWHWAFRYLICVANEQ